MALPAVDYPPAKAINHLHSIELTLAVAVLNCDHEDQLHTTAQPSLAAAGPAGLGVQDLAADPPS